MTLVAQSNNLWTNGNFLLLWNLLSKHKYMITEMTQHQFDNGTATVQMYLHKVNVPRFIICQQIANRHSKIPCFQLWINILTYINYRHFCILAIFAFEYRVVNTDIFDENQDFVSKMKPVMVNKHLGFTPKACKYLHSKSTC